MRQTTVEVDFEDAAASVLVVEAIAEATDADPAELDAPLGEVVDPYALDALFEHDSFCGALTFRYGPHEVTVERTEPANGRVTVR